MIDDDLPIKIVIVGDSNVGKTCLLKRYCDDNFPDYSPMTIGVDFKTKIVTIDGMKIKLQIWDTAGAERFRSISVSYYRGSHGIMILCDLSYISSIESINTWIQTIKDRNIEKNVCTVIVGCKSDIAKEANINEAKKIALNNGLHYFELSSKENVGIDDAFYYIATLAYHIRLNNDLR